jgi:hypothetical protein
MIGNKIFADSANYSAQLGGANGDGTKTRSTFRGLDTLDGRLIFSAVECTQATTGGVKAMMRSPSVMIRSGIH